MLKIWKRFAWRNHSGDSRWAVEIIIDRKTGGASRDNQADERIKLEDLDRYRRSLAKNESQLHNQITPIK